MMDGISPFGRPARMSCVVCIRRMILYALLVIPIVPHAQIATPEQVHPSTGTFEELRKASTDVAQTVGEHLDEGHDWIYRRIERWIERVDIRFAGPEDERVVVPLSPCSPTPNTFSISSIRTQAGSSASTRFRLANRLPSLSPSHFDLVAPTSTR